MIEGQGDTIPENFNLSHLDEHMQNHIFNNSINTVKSKCLGLFIERDKTRGVEVYNSMMNDTYNKSFIIEIIRRINQHGKLPDDDDLWYMMCNCSLLYWGINSPIYG